MIINQITPNHTKKAQQPNFRGITKLMSKRIYIDGKKDISELLEQRNGKNTYVGQLPPYWFYALDKDKRPETIKKIYETFDEVANEIRNFRPSISSDDREYRERRPNSSVQKLKSLFVELGLLKEDDYFDIKNLGAGMYKRAFKLDGVKGENNEEYCLKVFHTVDKTPEWHKYKSHGNFAEINTAIYWKTNLGQNTQRGKFYFGNIDNGYFVDKFVDEHTPKPQKDINEYEYGLKTTDEAIIGNGHNVLYGYSIDPGGVRVVNKLKNGNKVARMILKTIKNTAPQEREAKWQEIYESNANYPKSDKYAGLALCIKHLPNKEEYVEKCLTFNDRKADIGIAYALKYLTDEQAKRYFEILMKRQDPEVQVVLLNEIPLLAREPLASAKHLNAIEERLNITHKGANPPIKFDDLDVPKGEIRRKFLSDLYSIAEQYAVPEAEEHLASYVHLLPSKEILPAAEKLIQKRHPKINDRLLHKIKFVKTDDYSFSDKMSVLELLNKYPIDDEFLKQKAQIVKIEVIRSQCADD